MRVIYIDHQDAFTYNIVDTLKKAGCEVDVYQSDTPYALVESEIKKVKPKLIIIGSGSNTKREGISIQMIDKYTGRIPILGIGFGTELIIKAYNGKIGKAPEVLFGRQAKIQHDNATIYKGLEPVFMAAAYHSMVGVEIPYCMEVAARSDTGTIMGIRHKEHFVEGIQFNPGSILTPIGPTILENALHLASRK